MWMVKRWYKNRSGFPHATGLSVVVDSKQLIGCESQMGPSTSNLSSLIRLKAWLVQVFSKKKTAFGG